MKSNNNGNKLYLAYGSNLNLEQMKSRCPYAVPLGTAELLGYRLLFRGGNGGAVATVEPFEGGSVPVLLWEITPRDEEALDRYEGWPHLYRKETVTATLDSKPVDAMVYIMNDGRSLGQPGKYYLNAILEGYASAGFDAAVLDKAMLVSVTVKNCRLCKTKLVWEDTHTPGRFHESSGNLEDWPICHECMVDYCFHMNCLACNYGKYPDCRFLEMKKHYMSKN